MGRLTGKVAIITGGGRGMTRDTVVGGVDIPAGSKVVLIYGAANLDASAFDCPAKFDLDRRAQPHVTFGHGIHRCAGEHLARAEMRITLERVLDRMPDISLVGEVEFGGETAFNRGPLTLPVTFSARPAVKLPTEVWVGPTMST